MIVLLVLVYVVNHLSVSEPPTELGFHDEDVLTHVSDSVGPVMFGQSYQSVSLLQVERSFPECGVAVKGAEPWTVVSSSANRNDLPAGRAVTGRTLGAAFKRAEVEPPGSNLALWAMKTAPTPATRHIVRERFDPPPSDRQRRSSLVADLSLPHARYVALAPAVDRPARGETAWRQIHLLAAGRADTEHRPILPHVSRRWKVKDCGHVEFPSPAVLERRA